ncbi:MAG: sugar ABC transporter permease [Lachnospiraceae bacterium]|nr:sugar ABC transporter permease [Lachnospiraceae bacterium]
MKKVLGNKKAIALFVVPALIIYTIIVVAPILVSFYYSFFSGSPGLKWEFVGLKNFVRPFSDSRFLDALKVNLKYIAFVMAGQVILGLAMALMFRFWLTRFKNIIRTLVFFPVVLPTVAVGQLFAKIYEIQPNYGLLNSVLANLGFVNLVHAWIGESNTALGSLIVMDIWTAIGFYAVIFYGAILDISDDVIEAARIDGAGAWQLFRYVLAPLLRPMIITCLIFSFSGTVKMFESSKALTGGGPGNATKSLSMYMYDVAFNNSKVGYGSVIALFIFLLCIVGSAVIGLFDRKEEF